MLERLRTQVGTAGLIVAIVALVAALGGGAYAATAGSSGTKATASAKAKQGKPGKTGPAGPAGPTGPAGAKGDTGAAGANGKDGTPGALGTPGAQGTPGSPGAQGNPGSPGANGNSVLNGTGSPSPALGANGDFYIRTDTSEIYGPKKLGAWGSPTSLKGETGFTETLPSGKTETGTWGGFVGESEAEFAPFSFNIPLAALPAGSNIVPAGGPVPAECENSEHAGTASAANPEAAPGQFCAFVASFFNGSVSEILSPGLAISGAGKTGGILVLESEPGFSGLGSWAVTAE